MKKRNPLLRKKNIKRESRRRRMRILSRFFLVLALTSGVGLGGREALRRLEFFSLKRILVVGKPQTLSEAEILQRSGVKVGANLFKIPIKEIQIKLKEHPFFKSVVVQRHLPNTLVIEVKEYFPEFILNTGRLYYVDAEGEIFKDITNTEDKRDYPVLSGITEALLLTQALKIKEAISQAVQLKNVYKQSSYYSQFGLSEIVFEKNIGFTLYPEKKKYSIKFGEKDFSDKVKKLEEFWTRMENSQTKISSIDLNYPGKILMTL